MIEQITRRKLIGGLGLLIAAPAIVRASSRMPVKAYDDVVWLQFDFKAARTVGEIHINGREAIITKVEVSNDLKIWTELPVVLGRLSAGDLVAGRYHRLHLSGEAKIDSMEMLET